MSSRKPPRDVHTLISLFMPAAKEGCRRMRSDDVQEASTIIGNGVWADFSHQERCLVGAIFYEAVEKGYLPLKMVRPPKKSILRYRLK